MNWAKTARVRSCDFWNAEMISIILLYGIVAHISAVFDYAGDPEFNGRSMMKHFKVKTDDTVGVAVQQSDLPMVQFLLNGEPLHEHAINRFRGLVYPAIYLPESDEEIQIELVMHEDGFRQMAPHARFGPIIVARGLI